MTDDAARLDVEDGVATVTLNRPDRRNAMSATMAEALERHVETATDRDDVRCLVVTGAGDSFCAGGDIERMRERLDGGETVDDKVRELREGVSAGVSSVATCPLPTVAKVAGPAVGAGATLAIACDLQVASTDAVVGFAFRQVGLSVDSGASYLLPRLVGTNVAKRLVYTGELLDAEAAADLGLFTHVVDADEFEARADEVITEVATGPTVALRHAKRLVDAGFEKSYERAVDDEAVAQGIAYETDDHREGVEAFLEKRDPEFEGR